MDEKTKAELRKKLQDFYFKRVKNKLKYFNEKRKQNSLNTVAFIIVLIGCCISLLGLAIENSNDTTPIYILSGLSICCVGLLLPKFIPNNTSATIFVDFSGEADIKEELMPWFLNIFSPYFRRDPGIALICRLYGDNCNKQEIYEKLFNKYMKLKLLEKSLTLSLDDTITGSWENVNFKILEFNSKLLTLEKFTVFIILIILLFPIIIVFAPILIPIFIYKLIKRCPIQGVVVEFDMNKNFTGHTIILENKKTRHSLDFDTNKYEEVILEDSDFNKKFKVFSTDQVEARYLLTTGFMRRFKNIENTFNAKFIRASFNDGQIFLGINANRDLFKMADLTKDTDCNTFTKLFDEIVSILELIDELKLNQKLGL